MKSKPIAGLPSLWSLRQLYENKRVLLITGRQSYEASGAKASIGSIFSSSQAVLHFNDFEVNPKIEDAVRGANLARQFEAELIFAVGGGSVLDMAKLIKAFYSCDDKQAVELVKGKAAFIDSELPIVAVPTTAGSGSEATHFSVVYIDGKKYSLAAQQLRPEYTVLDGSLVASATPYQLSCNALDALSQAIESYWAVGSTSESRKLAGAAIRKAWPIVQRVAHGHGTESEYQDMIEAANLAGKAIDISKTTACHAWSYGFTARYAVPHGHAVWLTLPSIFGLHLQVSDSRILDNRGPEFFRERMEELCDLLKISNKKDATRILLDFLDSINIEPNMEAMGVVSTIDKELIITGVNVERLRNHPINLAGFEKEIFGVRNL